MSHTVRHKTQCTNVVAIKKAATRVQAQDLGAGKHKLFSGTYNGYGVQLQGWRYPLIIDTASGDIKFDNYNGQWGNGARLDEFKQGYGIELAKDVAEKEGHTVVEKKLEAGEVELEIHVGAGAGSGGGDGLSVGPSL